MRIAINGFGRIGRTVLRTLLEKGTVEIAAINDLADAATLAHLVKYDTVHRGFKGTVEAGDKEIIVNGSRIPVFAETNPASLPWKELEIDLVIESTGKFTSYEKAALHLEAGAKQVIISAPPNTKGVPTVV
jgi:glyceraldehyde 3-phosphate dehydrogenase